VPVGRYELDELPDDDMCGQVCCAEPLFGAPARLVFGAALLFWVVEWLLCVAAFPCVAAIAAPLPAVSASRAEATSSVRLGLRIDTSFRASRTLEGEQPRLGKRWEGAGRTL